MSVLYVDEFMK